MGLGTFIGRLFGRPSEARDDFVRSTIRFMELDRERIKKRLNPCSSCQAHMNYTP